MSRGQNRDWTDEENDRLVASYFAMLRTDLAGKPYVKSTYNQQLQDITGRSKGSIELKFQNLSAVLQVIGEIWIPGYKPLKNFQSSLVAAVERWLDANPEYLEYSHHASLEEAPTLWMGVPPVATKPSREELRKALPVARKFDVEGRDARNRELGLAGEKLVLEYEQSSLRKAGRPDLARLVRWTSQDEGDGLGYDITSFYPDGSQRLIEVKTTNGYEWTGFHISRNELRVSRELHEQWRLCRVWNFSREPRAFELMPPLEAHVNLTATSFRATLY